MKDNSYHDRGRLVRAILFGMVLTCCSVLAVIAQDVGSIVGKVTDAKTKDALGGINVRVKGTTLGAATENDGTYVIRNVPDGVYTIVFSAIGYTPIEIADVKVRTNETANVDAALSSRAIPISETIVFGASLKAERVTEAPAAVSVVGLQEMKNQASNGQLPKLLESQPGVDIVQSGVQDFNINTRGFNKSINRRLLVLLDGRDLAIVLLGVQEWNGLSVPLEDLGKVELIRGPGSALYGANAYNGVISISTPAPKEILGTKISFTGGELATFRGDVRHAAVLGDWSYKFNFGGVRTDTWTASRTANDALPGSIHTDPKTGFTLATFDYTNLLVEQRRYDPNHLASVYGSARFDRDMGEGSTLTFESGITQVENEVFLTGIGRIYVPKARKPWGRAAYSSEHFFAQVWAGGRKSIGPHYSLQTGDELDEASENAHIEFQHRFSVLDDQLHVVWGASHRYQHEDTQGTLMPSPRFDNWSGVFGQAEYKFTEEVKGIVAGRLDRSTLHNTQFSPKAAIVVSPWKDHSFRLSFNRAFQVPNYSELFLRAAAGAPVDFSPLEAGLRASALGPVLAGVPRGTLFTNSSAVPVLAIGNSKLGVETINGGEFGYTGVLENKVFLTIDLYYNQLTDFVTALLPGVNPAYQPWTAPQAVPAQYRAALESTVRSQLLAAGGQWPAYGLTRLPDGSTAIVISYANAGKVDEKGIEVGGKVYVSDEFTVDVNWAYFDFSVKTPPVFQVKEAQITDALLPNTPRHKVNIGFSYSNPVGFNAGLTARWVEKFSWAGGIFNGNVPEYTLVNLNAGYQLTRNVYLGVNISNLLNRKHYEIFGGSILERRGVATLTTTF
jgi:outer membrane receptor for ferrienterochelin and colicins